MNSRHILICLLGAAMVGIQTAHAALGVTNGDFETGGGNNLDNVTDWFDYNSGSFWQGAWQTNASNITPNGTNVVVLSSNDNSQTTNSTASADPNDGSYLYQSIGTADGATSLQVNFDFGQPDDDPGGRTLGITVGIYAYDGLGGFTEADNADVRGASGVTLLGSQSFSLVSTSDNDVISAQTATFDISGAGSQQLFLRFNNYRPADTESWSVIDNVIVALVADLPAFSVQPNDHFGFVGDAVSLDAIAVADPAPSYQWEYSVDGLDPWDGIAGETGPSLVLSPAAYSDNGYYRVVASNVNGSTTSDVVRVDLIYPVPNITQQPVSVAAFAGSDTQLSVTATGLGNLTYQWYKVDAGGDIELSGETTDTLHFTGLDAGDEGSYYVVVADDAAVADEGFPTETSSATATVSIVDVQVTASDIEPTTDSFDQFYLPGNVDDVDNIDGSPGGVPITASDMNDVSTYVAFDKTSQGMSFTTGSDPLGYTISSVTVRNVIWNNFLGNGTYYNVQNGDTFEFQFGTVAGAVKTPIFDTKAAQYTGAALVNAANPNNLGSGQYLTFDLSGAGIGTLTPNTTYYFEMASETGDAYFELSGTSVDDYAGGTAFRGDTIATIDDTYVELAGDRAFHVDLEGLSGPAGDFNDWIANYPAVGGLNGFADDADGDGIKNGLENFFGTDPSAASAGITEVARNGNTVTFQHPQSGTLASDVSAAYMWSTDLLEFHSDGETFGGTTVSFAAIPNTPVAGMTTVTATVTGTASAKLFVSVSATLDAP